MYDSARLFEIGRGVFLVNLLGGFFYNLDGKTRNFGSFIL